ncbi:unnamed protein product [Zymoseptoria tritici ST99CH_3D7]|uniref:FHA domain-containing protein n=1 Tax=Zymoseptoria tritici (strain ST99CH_3D7) TaxID=1276538 RepID=A0A1X7RL99_ZYMT9|nr:unnamed protein product [Zymoseptoria tritici ST99CH_3D7]
MLGPAQPTHLANFTTDASNSSPTTTPTRPSRLRGLSYLRTYTSNHLHSRSSAEPPPLPSPPLTRSTSSPSNVPTTATYVHRSQESPSNNRIHTAENGWIPTIQGRSGLNRDSPHPTSTSTDLASPEPQPTMTRSRTAESITSLARASNAQQSGLEDMAGSSTAAAGPSGRNGTAKDQLPAIRFIPHIESRSSRPSLQFSALSRTLKSANSVVRVGRYSERDNTSSDPNILPVGFKSKVVSRRHCEFWCTDGQWFIKDVKSSSGTFLNHVRLSSPGVESRPFPVNDGDVVQLGIDFKGGEEVIFRCVKIRVECNRNWQKSLNSFNKSAHKRLFKSALKSKTRDSDATSVNSSECSICLNPVAPCQALFVAPCSHVWHYKCVKNLIHGPSYPNFLCPNCRFVADLEDDVEPAEEEEEFEEYDEAQMAEDEQNEATQQNGQNAVDRLLDASGPHRENDHDNPAPRIQSLEPTGDLDDDFTHLIEHVSLADSPASDETSSQAPHIETHDHAPMTPSRSAPIAIPVSSTSRAPSATRTDSIRSTNRSTATDTDNEDSRPTTGGGGREGFSLGSSVGMTNGLMGGVDGGPMTPRNDVGPWVFDGSAGMLGGGENGSLIGRAVGGDEADRA